MSKDLFFKWDLNEFDFVDFLTKNSIIKNASRIIIAGPFCSGKTEIGKLLEKKLNLKFYDLDNCMNSAKSEIKNYRDLESNALEKFLKTELKNKYILSLGGGTLLLDKNIDLVKNANIDLILFLDPPVKKIFKNLSLKDNLEKRKFLPQIPWQINDSLKILEMIDQRREAIHNFKYFKKCLIIK